MRQVRADGAHVCIASPSSGRSPSLSGPCQCPFLDGGPVHSGHSQDIGVDFAIKFGFAENNQKKIAGCDTRTSHPAITELCRVQLVNFAPCDSLMSHPATSRYRTLPLPSVAQCDSKSPLLTPKIPSFAPDNVGIALSLTTAASHGIRQPFRRRPRSSSLHLTATSYILDPIQLGLSLLAPLVCHYIKSIS